MGKIHFPNLSEKQSHILNTSPAKSPFASIEWYKAFEDRISFDETNHFLGVESGETESQLAVLAFCERTQSTILGSRKSLHSMTNFYSPSFDIVQHVDSRINLTDILSEHSEFIVGFDTINIWPITRDQAEDWANQLETFGFESFTYPITQNWFLDNITSFDEFWSSRPSQLKNTIKRKRDKMTKSGEYEFKFSTNNDLTQMLCDFHHVYFHSWKKNEPFPSFIDNLVSVWGAKEQVVISVLYHNNLPVAAQLWFFHGCSAYIFKLAHRPQYSKMSAGSLLTEEMFKYAIDVRNVTRIDFLTGDDSYKKDWMSSSQTLYSLKACNKSRLFGLAERVKCRLDRDMEKVDADK